MSQRRHPFIVIEGLDGTGKTTLRKALFRLWDGLYGVTPLCVLTTNFLDPSVAGDLVDGKYAPTPDNRDRYLDALRADKAATLRGLVVPALPIRPVIADRWLLSELAFFAVKHGDDPHRTYRQLASGMSEPANVTIVLDLPAEQSLLRAHDRHGDATRPDWDVLGIQERLRHTYADVVDAPDEFPLLGDVVGIETAGAGPATVLHRAWKTLAERAMLPDLPRMRR